MRGAREDFQNSKYEQMHVHQQKHTSITKFPPKQAMEALHVYSSKPAL